VRQRYRTDSDVPGYRITRISGAVADTEIKTTPGVVGRIIVGVPGAAGAKVTVYDGEVSGTPIGEYDGDGSYIHMYQLDRYHATSIHIATTDSGGNMRVMVCWL